MYQKTILDNGLRIISETMPQTHSASICIFVGVGSRYETNARAGISHFVEHGLFRGTQKRPTSRDISEAIEGVGGVLNGGTDRESTVYWCKVARPHFEMALDVLSDMLLNSRFETEDIEKERQVIIEEINMSYDSPSSKVGLIIEKLLWPADPLGRDIAGTKKSVSCIRRTDLLEYIRKQYIPAKTVVSIAGNVEHKEAVAAVKKCLGGWTGAGQRPGHRGFREHQASRVGIETRDIEQTHMCLALPGLSLFDPQRFTLDMMNVILGEGMSSRLFCEVRDKLGLAYSVQSYVDHLKDTGSLIVYAGVDTSKARLALAAIIKELMRFKEETISPPELSKAKEMSKGQLALRLEDSRHVAGWLGGQETLTGRILTLDDVNEIVDSVKAEDIKHLAHNLINRSKMRLAVVGPLQKPEQLSKLIEAD
ncbi:MAG: insulinase family protein [Dehalococcoidia bacterium]|nr:MAG: insulinase family protein [Dehalococcoidia bacterium]